MAYKFQLGTAKLSGSIVSVGELDVTDDIIAGEVSASGDVTLAGTGSNVNTVTLSSESVLESDVIVISGGSGIPLAQLDSNTNVGRVRLFSGSNSAVVLTSDAGTGSISLNDGTNGNTEVTIGRGNISGSSNGKIGGALTIGDAADVQGSLTVQGTIVALSSSNVEVTKILTIDSGEGTAASVDGAFIFGAGTGTGGARIVNASGSDEGLHLKIMNGDESAAIAAQGMLAGDGTGLSNVGSAGSLNFSISEKSAVAGDVLEKEKINVVITFNNNHSNTVKLPGTASLANGDIVSVKFNDANLGSTKSCEIAASGSDVVSIDGSSTIRIDSPFAAMDLVYLGVINSSGSFAIL